MTQSNPSQDSTGNVNISEHCNVDISRKENRGARVARDNKFVKGKTNKIIYGFRKMSS